MMKGLCGVHKLAWGLVLVGAVNWGLVALFDWNIVEAILGKWETVMDVVYVLIGLAAIAMLATGSCKACKK